MGYQLVPILILKTILALRTFSFWLLLMLLILWNIHWEDVHIAQRKIGEYEVSLAIKQLARVSNNSTFICGDGWVSRSVGSGTCSHHDGILESVQSVRKRANINPQELFAARRGWMYVWTSIFVFLFVFVAKPLEDIFRSIWGKILEQGVFTFPTYLTVAVFLIVGFVVKLLFFSGGEYIQYSNTLRGDSKKSATPVVSIQPEVFIKDSNNSLNDIMLSEGAAPTIVASESIALGERNVSKKDIDRNELSIDGNYGEVVVDKENKVPISANVNVIGNQNGYVVSLNNNDLLLGKSCDVKSNAYGDGIWGVNYKTKEVNVLFLSNLIMVASAKLSEKLTSNCVVGMVPPYNKSLKGVPLLIGQNIDGFTIVSAEQVVFLGKSCDSFLKNAGKGAWNIKDGRVSVFFEKGFQNFSFVAFGGFAQCKSK